MTLLLADFGTFNQIHGMSGLSGIAPAVLRNLECTPSGREWFSAKATEVGASGGWSAAAVPDAVAVETAPQPLLQPKEKAHSFLL